MPFKELERWADFVNQSGLYGAMTKPQALVLGMEAQAYGIHPSIMIKKIHIVQGRACMKSQAILAEFKRRGGKYEILESTNEICRIRGTAADGSTHTEEFGRVDAERIKHGQGTLMQKDNYKHYAKKMFFWRASKNLVDMLEPEAALGFLLQDEAEEIAANNPYAPQVAETGPVTDGAEIFEPQAGDIFADPETIKRLVKLAGGKKAAYNKIRERYPDAVIESLLTVPAAIAGELIESMTAPYPEKPATGTPDPAETKPAEPTEDEIAAAEAGGKLTDAQVRNGEIDLED
ncbi:MAG: hypothetical protein ABII20_06350, partial [Candidatus Omnitrophota bacterium]